MRINEVAVARARKIAEKCWPRLSSITRKKRSRRKTPVSNVQSALGPVQAIRGSRRMTA